MLGNFMWNCLSLFPFRSSFPDWGLGLQYGPGTATTAPAGSVKMCCTFYTRLLSAFLIPKVQFQIFFFKIHAPSKPPHQWKLNPSMTPKVSICALIRKSTLTQEAALPAVSLPFQLRASCAHAQSPALPLPLLSWRVHGLLFLKDFLSQKPLLMTQHPWFAF